MAISQRELDKGHKAMAADAKREQEAKEWIIGFASPSVNKKN